MLGQQFSREPFLAQMNAPIRSLDPVKPQERQLTLRREGFFLPELPQLHQLVSEALADRTTVRQYEKIVHIHAQQPQNLGRMAFSSEAPHLGVSRVLLQVVVLPAALPRQLPEAGIPFLRPPSGRLAKAIHRPIELPDLTLLH